MGDNTNNMEPINLLIKPASGNCNMRCKYCFYVDEMENRETYSYGRMSLDTLEAVIKKSLAYAKDYCMIAFQGGEPTLVGLDFYKKVVEFAEKYNRNHCKIEYSLQTNGYLLDEAWAQFFAKNGFLIGISMDGNEEVHNHYRVDKDGAGTHERVQQAIELLKKYNVEFNILTVVTKELAANAAKVYRFYKRKKYKYQQYIECLDPLECEKERYGLTAEDYLQFLKDLFDEWYQDMIQGRYVYIRYFENLIMMLAGRTPESCTLRGQCGKQWVIEADASVYPCDFYAMDEWKLGNLLEDDMEKIEQERKRIGFLQKAAQFPKECQECRWFGLCHNGCKRNCIEGSGNAQGKNRFCKAYAGFLEYAYPRLVRVAKAYEIPVVYECNEKK